MIVYRQEQITETDSGSSTGCAYGSCYILLVACIGRVTSYSSKAVQLSFRRTEHFYLLHTSRVFIPLSMEDMIGQR